MLSYYDDIRTVCASFHKEDKNSKYQNLSHSKNVEIYNSLHIHSHIMVKSEEVKCNANNCNNISWTLYEHYYFSFLVAILFGIMNIPRAILKIISPNPDSKMVGYISGRYRSAVKDCGSISIQCTYDFLCYQGNQLG